jgi:hypothetical protein
MEKQSQTQSLFQLLDENSARSLIVDVISRSWLETWGGALFSVVIYCLVMSGLLFNPEVTLAWGWRVLALLFFALIPAVAVYGALVHGRFVLGLSKQGLLYMIKGADSQYVQYVQYVLCPWSNVVSVQHHYDGENDFVAIGLKDMTAAMPTNLVNGHVEDRAGVRLLFMDAVSKRRALQIIDVIEREIASVK